MRCYENLTLLQPILPSNREQLALEYNSDCSKKPTLSQCQCGTRKHFFLYHNAVLNFLVFKREMDRFCFLNGSRDWVLANIVLSSCPSPVV